MKLIRCYIENFGGLQQYTAHFQEGLTVIHEANGFGKTTLAEFIRAMFYGFPRSAKDIEKNPRLKYLPWQGGRYGGYLIFEHNGKHYRIDRTFGETARQDKAKLFDEATHRESRDFSPDTVGLQLFGMDSDSFLRSTYMPQTPLSGSLSTDSIRARLSSLLEDSDDLAGYEKAVQRLKDKRSAYRHYRGTGGSIQETQKQMTSLQNQLDACRNKLPELEQTTSEIVRLQQERQLGELALRRIRTQLTDASSALAERALSREYESLLARNRDTASRLQAHAADDDALQPSSPKMLHGGFLSLLILGIFAAAAGICLLMLPTLPDSLAAYAAQYRAYIDLIFANRIPIGGVSCGAAVLMLTAAISLQMKHNLRKELAAEAALRAQQTLSAMEAAAVQAKQALDSFLTEHGPKPASALPQAHHDWDSLQVAEQQLLAKQSARNTRLLQLEQRQRILQAEADRIPQLTDELSRCSAQKAEDSERCRLLDETVGFLQTARESLSNSYLGSVQSHFAAYLHRLSGENPEGITVNSDLEVRLERAGSARSLSYFSAGQNDLVQLCMRLALSDALFKEERCFMILDDPFVNLDNNHLKQALALLQELSNDRQIIYLVCSSSRMGKEQP